MTMFWYKLVGILLKKLHLGMGINSSTDNPSPVHGYIDFCRLKLNDGNGIAIDRFTFRWK